MGDRTFAVVLLSRFTPGLRLPVYVAAGVLSKDFLKFSSALLLAAVVWTPLLVGAGGAVAESSEAITNGVWGGIALPGTFLSPLDTESRFRLQFLWASCMRADERCGSQRAAAADGAFLPRSVEDSIGSSFLHG